MKVKRKVSKNNRERDLKILKDYNAGVSMIDMIIKYKITSSRIYQILKDME